MLLQTVTGIDQEANNRWVPVKLLQAQGYYHGCQQFWIPKLTTKVLSPKPQLTLRNKECPPQKGIKPPITDIASTSQVISESLEQVHPLQQVRSDSQNPIKNTHTQLPDASRAAKGKEKIADIGFSYSLMPTALQTALPLRPITPINVATVTVPSLSAKSSQKPLKVPATTLHGWAALSYQLDANNTPWYVSAGIKSKLSAFQAQHA